MQRSSNPFQFLQESEADRIKRQEHEKELALFIDTSDSESDTEPDDNNNKNYVKDTTIIHRINSTNLDNNRLKPRLPVIKSKNIKKFSKKHLMETLNEWMKLSRDRANPCAICAFPLDNIVLDHHCARCNVYMCKSCAKKERFKTVDVFGKYSCIECISKLCNNNSNKF